MEDSMKMPKLYRTELHLTADYKGHCYGGMMMMMMIMIMGM